MLDVDPVLPAARARPDRSVDRVIAERGWIEADRPRAPHRPASSTRRSVAGWSTDQAHGRRRSAGCAVRSTRPASSASTSPHSTSGTVRCSTLLEDVAVDRGRARPIGAADPLAGHPFVSALEAAPFNPPAPVDVSRDELRRTRPARPGDRTGRHALRAFSAGGGGPDRRPAARRSTRGLHRRRKRDERSARPANGRSRCSPTSTRPASPAAAATCASQGPRLPTVP